MAKNIQLDVYHGKEASVNAYLFSDGESMIAVDCLRNSEEASLLADRIKSHQKPLTHILITHGHPDHFLGMNVLKQQFPHARIVVTKAEIKKDITGFAAWMESVGWLEAEPAMKPKTATNENGFDYEANVEVLNADTLALAEGAVLEINSDYDPSECEHLTTIYSRDLNAFFPNDFVYHGVHPWLAVDQNNIDYWKTQLNRFKTQWEGQNPKIYPGHGIPGDVSMFDEMRKYIEDFEATIKSSKNRAEAMDTMKKLYPKHQQAHFLLFHSVNGWMPE